METYNVVGLMSGSSLDGLDIAYCEIVHDNGAWSYQIKIAETIPFTPKWKLRLEKLVLQNAVTYIKTHAFLGHYFGELVKSFIEKHQLFDQIDFIASHGQTIFHQPDNGFTSQIGDPSAIAVHTGLPVISDFRHIDVALTGQGTPIAPIADQLFFNSYRFLINLGGISNITYQENGQPKVAFDITPVNLILNKLAGKMHLDFDKDGDIARSGQIIEPLYNDLNLSHYYAKAYPKSLSGGWVSKVMAPLVARYKNPVPDKLRTLSEHISHQIARGIAQIAENEGVELKTDEKMLATGGGALNKYLIELIDEKAPVSVIIPDEETIQFKEALLMALMGVLRVRNEVNCLSAVTGAKADSVGGAIYQGTEKKLKFN
ncbi:MAG: anhydro-N-acetylmuramic acid kinase [Chitinophagales bacterium]